MQSVPSKILAVERILQDNPDRFVLFPIKEEGLWKLYKNAMAHFWVAEEIDLTPDLKDWERLTDNERYFISHVLAFFAGSDGIVNENQILNFMREVQIPEARCFFGFQVMMENIHSETYSMLIDTFIKDKEEKYRLFHGIETIPCIKKKAEWALKYMDSEKNSFAERLVAFIIVEGLFFQSSFAAIFWLKKRGMMPGLTFSNELISVDEGMHVIFSVELYKMLAGRLDQEHVYQIFQEAVAIEKEFVTDSLPVDLIGINSKLMRTFVEYVADYWLFELKYQKIYKSQNPFDFYELISLEGKTNFFERRVSEYNKAAIISKMNNKKNDNIFTLDADF